MAKKGEKMSQETKDRISKTNFKGGFIDKNGHRILRIEGEYIPEHRMIWIRHNKIPIPKGFIVHHRDMNTLNNNIDNLLLLPREIHGQLHCPKGSMVGANQHRRT